MVRALDSDDPDGNRVNSPGNPDLIDAGEGKEFGNRGAPARSRPEPRIAQEVAKRCERRRMRWNIEVASEENRVGAGALGGRRQEAARFSYCAMRA